MCFHAVLTIQEVSLYGNISAKPEEGVMESELEWRPLPHELTRSWHWVSIVAKIIKRQMTRLDVFPQKKHTTYDIVLLKSQIRIEGSKPVDLVTCFQEIQTSEKQLTSWEYYQQNPSWCPTNDLVSSKNKL